MFPYQVKKSCISGKPVMVSNDLYPANGKFVSQDEISLLKFPPLSINEIKDIDSLFAAAAERTVYCGNKLFGKNVDVTDAENCVDCSSIFHGHSLYQVKYGAYVSTLREAEYVFGVCGFPQTHFGMRVCDGVGSNRCFETYYGTNLSDMYYAFNCVGCSDCIFAFNLRSKRHVIGNRELPKDEFMRLKKKLVSEMAGELKKKKRLFSVADIAYYGRNKKDVPEEKIAFDSPVPPKVEDAFSSTCKIVLGKEHKGIKKYGPWLLRRAVTVKKVIGAKGTPTYKVGVLPTIKDIPADRLVTNEEGAEAAKTPISIKPGEELTLQETLSRVAKNALFSVEFIDGMNDKCIDTPNLYGGSNIYKILDTTDAKYSAYSSAVIKSEHIFGGYFRLLQSQFCINIFDSTNLKGCFEVDCSYSSRNAYFCHNCENVNDALFCFNAKALQYAFCNQMVSKEEFLRLKKILLDYVNSELEKKGALEESVFNIPAKKRKK
ncbi:MAG: hypothetical protein NT051_06725, partial [Candidatus Micrarchaeota archaeon]|nr:hypothetical protein [Candidatus Micrarchaeota archaeon]